jgi:hypothetical protein
MKKQFVTYPIALKLKELRFSEPCLGYYPPLKKELTIWYNPEITNEGEFVLAPLWQQVIDWLEEEHNIYIWKQPINSFVDDEEDLNSCIFLFKKGIIDSSEECDNKEQGILKAIELCQKEK